MKAKIEKLLSKIASADWEVRTKALALLMTLDDPRALGDFATVLDRKSDTLCVYFCQYMGKTTLPEGIPYLLEFLSDPRLGVQSEAMLTFDRYLQSEKISDKTKASILIQAFKSSSEKTRTYAAECFGTHHRSEGVPYLIEGLEDVSGKVRLACVDSLRLLGEIVAIPYFLKRLKDSAFNVRYAACFALGEMGPGILWQHVVPLLEDPKVTVRQAATWSVARLGGQAAIPYLKRRLQKDAFPLVRIEAAKRLGKIPHRSVIAPLLNAYATDEDQNVRSAANFALDYVPAKIRIKVFLQQLRSSEASMRTAIIGQIAKIKTREALTVILKTYKKSKEPQIQAACCEGLGMIGDKKAIPVLLEIAKSNNPVVAYSAIRALAQIMGEGEKKLLVTLLKDNTLGELSHQILLQFILKKVTEGLLFLDQSLFETLLEKLVSPHINISYMAIRIFGAAKELSAIVPLLKLSGEATDPEVRSKCFQSIENILAGNVFLLVKLLKQEFVTKEAAAAIFECLRTFECKKQYKLSTLIGLLNYYMEHPGDQRMDIIALISQVVGQEPGVLLLAMYQAQWPENLLKDLLHILDSKISERHPNNVLLNIAPLTPMLNHSDREIRSLAIRLLEKIRLSEALPLLVARYFHEEDERVRMYTQAAIRSIASGE